MKTEMIFACHGGSTLGCEGVVGIVMNGHTLPLAFRETADCSAEDAGFKALWECFADVEEVFGYLRLGHCPEGPGIYHVEIDFDQDDVEEADFDDPRRWDHLADCHPYRVQDSDMLDALNARNGWELA